MTIAHLSFALATTAYVPIAIQCDEHNLVEFLPGYANYRSRVPLLLPKSLKPRERHPAAAARISRKFKKILDFDRIGSASSPSIKFRTTQFLALTICLKIVTISLEHDECDSLGAIVSLWLRLLFVLYSHLVDSAGNSFEKVFPAFSRELSF